MDHSGNLLRQSFYFSRHGETDWNLQNLCQGQKDIPLNENGLLQARMLAAQAKDLDVQCIVSSSLTRAIQTAKAVQIVHPAASFHILPQLSERGWGSLEGISSEEMYAIEKLEEEEPLYSPGQGVEGRSAFRQRVLQGMALAQNTHQNPFIISHGRVFMELCSILGVIPIRQISSCQLFEMNPTSDGWAITSLKP